MHNKSNYSPQAQTWPDVQLLQKSPRLKPASLTRGAKPLRGILTAFTAGWGVAAVCPWNQSHLAWSQQHEIPLSLQLAHCKLCRQGVPNKQATRANITCSTLLFLTAATFVLSPPCDHFKLYLWKYCVVIMYFVIAVTSGRRGRQGLAK